MFGKLFMTYHINIVHNHLIYNDIK